MKEQNFRQLINKGKIVIPDDTIKKWQEIVDTLSEILNVPAALIMKVDQPNIEVFRASESEDNPFKDGQVYKLAGVYCEEVIHSKKKLLVPNALKDKKWNHNPDLEIGMISYLGFPIICPDGSVFGTICISDTKENSYNNKVEELMVHYKDIIESHLKLIYQNFLVKESLDDLQHKEYELQKEIKNFEMNQVICADREMRIFELQKEVDSLRIEIGLTPKYYYVSGE